MSRERVTKNHNVKPADKMKALLMDAIISRMTITGVAWGNCKLTRTAQRGAPIIAEITPLMGITPYTFEIKVTQVVTRMKTGGKQARRSPTIREAEDLDYELFQAMKGR